jgi:8-oxo-dGTP pyrophosphatase MutT (NUDIX family)
MSPRHKLHRRHLRHRPFDPAVTIRDEQADHGAQQFAALPWRRGVDGEVKVLLITSRETRRWVIPKGWPMEGRTAGEAAVQEAYEEAGVFGEAVATPIGTYTYDKRLRDGSLRAVEVLVFPMEVFVEQLSFPEQGQRDKAWVSPAEAAERVDEPELTALILAFQP